MFSSEDVMTSEVVCPLTRFQMYGIWRYIIQHLYGIWRLDVVSVKKYPGRETKRPWKHVKLYAISFVGS